MFLSSIVYLFVCFIVIALFVWIIRLLAPEVGAIAGKVGIIIAVLVLLVFLLRMIGFLDFGGPVIIR